MASPIPDPIPAVPAGSPGGSGRGSGEPDPASVAELGRLTAEFTTRLQQARRAWINRLVILWRQPGRAAPADLAHLRAALAGLESVADYLGDPPASVSADLIPGLNLNHGPGGDAARS
jgi:hypothetical protein